MMMPISSSSSSEIHGTSDVDRALSEPRITLENSIPLRFNQASRAEITPKPQMKAAKKMGPLSSVLGMMGVNDLPQDMVKTSEDKLKYYEAMISSMTVKERKEPEILRKQKGRIERVAKGSGTKPEDVRELLTQFEKISNLMNGFKKNRGLRKKLEKFMKGKGMDPESLAKMQGGL